MAATLTHVLGVKHDTGKARVAEILTDFENALSYIAANIESHAYPSAKQLHKKFYPWFLDRFFRTKFWLHPNYPTSRYNAALLAYGTLIVLDAQARWEGVQPKPITPSPIRNLFDLIAGLESVINVGEYGAKKYEMGNWKQVPNAILRYTNAAGRHFIASAWEPKDEESKLSHLAHLTWNLLAVTELLFQQ